MYCCIKYIYIFVLINLNKHKMETTQKIIGWAVVYQVTRNAKLFANMKNETIECFKNQQDAINFCNNLNNTGYLDEMHVGYRVYPMNWIPKNTILK